jgi:5-methylcytosine-specific restriction endonuclease McrA
MVEEKGKYERTESHRRLMSKIKLKNNPLKGKPSHLRGKYKVEISKDKLIEMYHGKKLSLSKIGEKLSVNTVTVLNYMNRYNIKRRTVSEANCKHGSSKVAFDYYPNKCCVCNKTQRLEVHHIDSNRYNNSIKNLIILCISCHSKEHNRILNINHMKKKIQGKYG